MYNAPEGGSAWCSAQPSGGMVRCSRVVVMLDVEGGAVTEAIALEFSEGDTLTRVLDSVSFGPFDSRWDIGRWLSHALVTVQPL